MSKTRKILVVRSNYAIDGALTHENDIAKRLRDESLSAGVRVDVLPLFQSTAADVSNGYVTTILVELSDSR